MPDQNIPDNTRAARHAAEVKSMTIKIYCIIAFFDLGILGLFPNWWAANSLAVVTALLYLGVRYLANIDAAAGEAGQDDAVELREGVGHGMVSEWMAGGDDGARGEDAEGVEDAERFEDAEDSNDDGEEVEHEEHVDQPEEVLNEEGAASEIRSTQINIHIHRGGSMYINMMQGGTLHVNVFGEVDGLES